MRDGPPAPVAIGGVGGSGTRVPARALLESGRFMGSDLNDAVDNLWFTMLFRHPEVLELDPAEFDRLVAMFRMRMLDGDHRLPGADPDELAAVVRSTVAAGRQPPVPDWLVGRADTFLAPGPPAAGGRWGWKEPNTHVVLDRLDAAIADLRYVHLARNGLDMALSANQQQVARWAHAYGVDDDGSPAASLRYWRVAHERVLAVGERMGDRFLFLRFEELCTRPTEQLTRLLTFADGCEPDPALVERIAADVQAPPSIGRHLGVDRSAFDPEDVDYVRSLGFHV